MATRPDRGTNVSIQLNLVPHHDGERVVGFDKAQWPPVCGKSSLPHFVVESEVAFLASLGFMLNSLIFLFRRIPTVRERERRKRECEREGGEERRGEERRGEERRGEGRGRERERQRERERER